MCSFKCVVFDVIYDDVINTLYQNVNKTSNVTIAENIWHKTELRLNPLQQNVKCITKSYPDSHCFVLFSDNKNI